MPNKKKNDSLSNGALFQFLVGLSMLIGATTLTLLGTSGIVPVAVGAIVGVSGFTVGTALIGHMFYDNFAKIKSKFANISKLLHHKFQGKIAGMLQNKKIKPKHDKKLTEYTKNTTQEISPAHPKVEPKSPENIQVTMPTQAPIITKQSDRLSLPQTNFEKAKYKTPYVPRYSLLESIGQNGSRGTTATTHVATR